MTGYDEVGATLWLLLALALAALGTGLAVADFASDCAAQGGNPTIEGTTAWCRH